MGAVVWGTGSLGRQGGKSWSEKGKETLPGLAIPRLGNVTSRHPRVGHQVEVKQGANRSLNAIGVSWGRNSYFSLKEGRLPEER